MGILSVCLVGAHYYTPTGRVCSFRVDGPSQQTTVVVILHWFVFFFKVLIPADLGNSWLSLCTAAFLGVFAYIDTCSPVCEIVRFQQTIYVC